MYDTFTNKSRETPINNAVFANFLMVNNDILLDQFLFLWFSKMTYYVKINRCFRNLIRMFVKSCVFSNATLNTINKKNTTRDAHFVANGSKGVVVISDFWRRRNPATRTSSPCANWDEGPPNTPLLRSWNYRWVHYT